MAKNVSTTTFNVQPTGQKQNQGTTDTKRVTTKDKPNMVKNAFKKMITSADAKVDNAMADAVAGDTKSKGDGRNPTGGKGVTTDGSWRGWEHGSYEYDTSGASGLKASSGNPHPKG